jgi:hypothetical protein
VDQQCDLEVLCDSTQVVIKTSKVARHIGLVQCGHLAQAEKREHSPRCLEPKTPTYNGVLGETELQKEVQLASCWDAFAKEARQNIQNGAKSHFHLRNGLLWYKQNRLYVLEGKMRDTLLKECHDGPLAGHGGAKRITTFVKKSYYWPNLKDCVEEYVKTCLTCQQNRTLNKKQAGLLQPYQFPKGRGKVYPWTSW